MSEEHYAEGLGNVDASEVTSATKGPYHGSGIQVEFNVAMTFLLVFYQIACGVFEQHALGPYGMELLFPGVGPGEKLMLSVVGVPFLIVVLTYAIRALWNRLFPHLCGWKPMAPREAYALSLLVGFLH